VDIFGGTFDPVQAGHLELVRKSQAPDRVLLIAPTSQNPWKARKATPFALRMEMLRLALRWEKLEFVESDPKPGEIYLCSHPYERSIELLRWWRTDHSGEIRWLVGPGDAAASANWFRWIEEGCPIVEVISEYPFHSTDVREGGTVPHPAIAEFIVTHKLYQ